MNNVLQEFLLQKVHPLLTKADADPGHLEHVLTEGESIELILDLNLVVMVELGIITISERQGEFYFQFNGKEVRGL